jgi:HemY protein
MKRNLVIVLLVVLTAAGLGTLIAQDPGYVLIAYNGASMQTGLWVFLGMILTGVFGVYALFASLSLLLGSGQSIRRWQVLRRTQRATSLTKKGMAFLQQGEYPRAEKFLVSGVRNSDSPAANYIAAARAADAQSHTQERERYLRLAVTLDPSLKATVAITEAEMLIGRSDWHGALSSLEGLANTRATLNLRKQALLNLRDWQGLTNIMKELRKYADDPAVQLAFEKQVAQQRFASPNNTDDSLGVLFRRLSDSLKSDPELVADYCRRVRDDKQVESLLRSTIKHQWHDALVVAYGHAGKETLGKRLKTAQGWQKTHPDNWALQSCLGQLYEASGVKDEAKTAFEKSLNLMPSVLAHEKLAKLLAFDGEYARSSEHLRQALQIKAPPHSPHKVGL